MLCGSNLIEMYLVDFRGNQIFRCKNCGVQFMNPQYTDEYLGDFYSRYFHEGVSTQQMRERIGLFKSYLATIEKYTGVGSMLDIGCGDGHFMEAAMQKGWDVEGYDVDEDNVTKVSERLRVCIQSGDFLQANYLENSYDLIVMHQVLEHLKNPIGYLRRVSRLLREDGIVFIAVPNIASVSAALKRYLELRGFRKRKKGSYYDTDHHMWYFTPGVLNDVLRLNGFEVIYSRGCHRVRAEDSKLKELIKEHLWERFMLNSTFYVVAKCLRAPEKNENVFGRK